MANRRMLSEKECREARRADKYALSVKSCAADMVRYGEEFKPMLMSPSKEARDKFVRDVAKEIVRLKKKHAQYIAQQIKQEAH